jgi:hypothetical protein
MPSCTARSFPGSCIIEEIFRELLNHAAFAQVHEPEAFHVPHHILLARIDPAEETALRPVFLMKIIIVVIKTLK